MRSLGVGDKFRYYFTETYFQPGAYIGPAFRAGLRMANPPGTGPTKYPKEWSQGAEAFGRNYGDAFAERAASHTATFVVGAILKEDPRYIRSSSHSFLARSFHAVSFAFVDRSDSEHCMPAVSHFAGAAAGGFIGNAYLPDGFNNATHAGQRTAIGFGSIAAANLFQEFAPSMPRPVRTFFSLIGR